MKNNKDNIEQHPEEEEKCAVNTQQNCRQPPPLQIAVIDEDVEVQMQDGSAGSTPPKFVQSNETSVGNSQNQNPTKINHEREKLSEEYIQKANNYCVNNIGLPMVEDLSCDSDSWKLVSVQGAPDKLINQIRCKIGGSPADCCRANEMRVILSQRNRGSTDDKIDDV